MFNLIRKVAIHPLARTVTLVVYEQQVAGGASTSYTLRLYILLMMQKVDTNVLLCKTRSHETRRKKDKRTDGNLVKEKLSCNAFFRLFSVARSGDDCLFDLGIVAAITRIVPNCKLYGLLDLLFGQARASVAEWTRRDENELRNRRLLESDFDSLIELLHIRHHISVLIELACSVSRLS